MPEQLGGPQEVKFTPPIIDHEVEVVKPEHEAELQKIIEKYSDLIGVTVSEKGLELFYEDIFHSDQYGYFVIDNFFLEGAFEKMKDQTAGSIGARTKQLCVELVEFGRLRLGRYGDAVTAHLREVEIEIGEHSDNDTNSILANFNVNGNMYYELRPFVNDSVAYEDPLSSTAMKTPTPSTLDETKKLHDNREVFFTNTVRIPIKSNQLVYLERSVITRTELGRMPVTVPHAVRFGDNSDLSNKPSRDRLMVL